MEIQRTKVGYFYRCLECGQEMDEPDNMSRKYGVPNCVWCGGIMLERYIRQARPDGTTVEKLDRKVDAKVEEAYWSMQEKQFRGLGATGNEKVGKRDEKANGKNIGTKKLEKKLGSELEVQKYTIMVAYRRVFCLLHQLNLQQVEVVVKHVEMAIGVAVLDVKQTGEPFPRMVRVDLNWLLEVDAMFERALREGVAY